MNAIFIKITTTTRDGDRLENYLDKSKFLNKLIINRRYKIDKLLGEPINEHWFDIKFCGRSRIDGYPILIIYTNKNSKNTIHDILTDGRVLNFNFNDDIEIELIQRLQ